jgi:hypothetical protein
MTQGFTSPTSYPNLGEQGMICRQTNGTTNIIKGPYGAFRSILPGDAQGDYIKWVFLINFL